MKLLCVVLALVALFAAANASSNLLKEHIKLKRMYVQLGQKAALGKLTEADCNALPGGADKPEGWVKLNNDLMKMWKDGKPLKAMMKDFKIKKFDKAACAKPYNGGEWGDRGGKVATCAASKKPLKAVLGNADMINKNPCKNSDNCVQEGYCRLWPKANGKQTSWTGLRNYQYLECAINNNLPHQKNNDIWLSGRFAAGAGGDELTLKFRDSWTVTAWEMCFLAKNCKNSAEIYSMKAAKLFKCQRNAKRAK